MVLQGGHGVLVGDGAFDGLSDRTGLLGAESEDNNLLGGEDGRDTYGHRLLGNEIDVTAEEAGIHAYGVVGEGDHAGTALQGREGFVECDVAVFADSSEEEVESSGLDYLLFVGSALGREVGSVAVEDMDVCAGDVDMVEEVAVHEAVIALRMLDGQAHVLIHIESDHVLEAELAGLDFADEFGVYLERGGSGRKPQHKGLVADFCLCLDGVGDAVGHPKGGLFLCVSDNYFHIISITQSLFLMPNYIFFIIIPYKNTIFAS